MVLKCKCGSRKGSSLLMWEEKAGRDPTKEQRTEEKYQSIVVCYNAVDFPLSLVLLISQKVNNRLNALFLIPSRTLTQVYDHIRILCTRNRVYPTDLLQYGTYVRRNIILQCVLKAATPLHLYRLVDALEFESLILDNCGLVTHDVLQGYQP